MPEMKAWNIDANTIKKNELNTSDLSSLLVSTREIQDFLSNETRKMFIVAPKGVGKTFLLKVKSQLFRNSSNGFKFIPEETLCESFTSNELSYSDQDILKFGDRSIWLKLWELCVYTLIVKNFMPEELPPELAKLVGSEPGILSEILGTYLLERNNIDKYHAYIPKSLKPSVRRLREKSNANQVAIFLDNIDETFDSYVGFEAQSQGRLKGSSIWINAQLALLSVTKDICKSNSHIKIFITIRSEAYNSFHDPLKLQIDDLCVFLSYKKSQIKEIFLKNVAITEPSDLAKPDEPNLIRRLIGYDTILHKFVEDGNGQKKSEDVFDFIYRHTYGRPRDIVLMGKGIVEEFSGSDVRDPMVLGTVVNNQSYKLFEQLKDETVPIFEDRIFELFCERVSSNVIKFDDAFHIYQAFKKEGFDNVFSYFYRLGLVGTVDRELQNSGGEYRQRFLPVGQYSLTDDKVPEYQYFVLHPSLNKKMKQIHDVGFYDRFNIIGYDYPFNTTKINALEGHFHFGLDRDSMSVIIPEIQNAKCLAILNAANHEWRELEISRTFKLEVNKTECSFRVYHDNLDEVAKKEIREDWKDKKYHVLICSTIDEEISFFFERSTTVSLTLFYPFCDKLETLLKNYRLKNHLTIFLCLRVFNQQELDFLKQMTGEVSNTIEVQPALIDRFQHSQDQQFNPEESLLRCTINTEGYSGIVTKVSSNMLTKNLSVLRKAQSDSEFEFYVLRQNLILEGVFQFEKHLQFKGKGQTNGSQDLLKIFLHIQSLRIVSEISEDSMQKTFLGITRDKLMRDLTQYGLDVHKRVSVLVKLGLISTTAASLVSNKNRGLFPNDEQIYGFIHSYQFFYTQTVQCTEFLKVFECSSLSKFYTLFISYSYLDREFANKVYNCLILKGIEVKMHEKDNPVGYNKVYMDESISSTARMLFIASENSLKSDPCHFELSRCLELVRKENSSKRLIAIRLDDYVLKMNIHEVVDEKRQQNIQALRGNTNIIGYDYQDTGDIRMLDDFLDHFVKLSLVRS
jgi:TIR domain